MRGSLRERRYRPVFDRFDRFDRYFEGGEHWRENGGDIRQ
jgi:hypothetical protein